MCPAASKRSSRLGSSANSTLTTPRPRPRRPPWRYSARACCSTSPPTSRIAPRRSAVRSSVESPRSKPERATWRRCVANRPGATSKPIPSTGQRWPCATSTAASWKTPPPTRFFRLRPHLQTRARHRRDPLPTVRHLTWRVDREVALMHMASLHRQRVPWSGLTISAPMLRDPASLTIRAFRHRHRPPLALLLHVWRTHERTRQPDLDLQPRLVAHSSCTPRRLPTRHAPRPCPEPTVDSRSRSSAVGFPCPARP